MKLSAGWRSVTVAVLKFDRFEAFIGIELPLPKFCRFFGKPGIWQG
jgi:hypothetical protein